jgi:hypothetical protein
VLRQLNHNPNNPSHRRPITCVVTQHTNQHKTRHTATKPLTHSLTKRFTTIRWMPTFYTIQKRYYSTYSPLNLLDHHISHGKPMLPSLSSTYYLRSILTLSFSLQLSAHSTTLSFSLFSHHRSMLHYYSKQSNNQSNNQKKIYLLPENREWVNGYG